MPACCRYQRTCPVYFLECMGYNATDGTANAPVNVRT